MKLEIIIIMGLLLGICVQMIPSLSSEETFEVMPIVTPVSLQYEKEYLGEKQPRSLPDITQVLQRINDKNVDSTTLAQLKKERLEMLDLRNQRHELNIKMMENAVEILSELTPEQWDFIQSNRDEIQSKIELDVLEKVLQDLEK